MAADLAGTLSWTFRNECRIPQDVAGMLVQGERPWAAYQTIRDIAIFTDRRIIIRDAQGMTGKKVEVYTIPYSSIVMYSTENAHGALNFNSELELWTKAGHMKILLSKGIDIRKLDNLIATALVG